jgi:hypothetical protein
MAADKSPDKTADTAADDIRIIFDKLSDDVLLHPVPTAVILNASGAALKHWRQEFQNGKPLRGPKPLIVAGSLIRYRVGDIREYLRSLSAQTGVVSTRGRRAA